MLPSARYEVSLGAGNVAGMQGWLTLVMTVDVAPPGNGRIFPCDEASRKRRSATQDRNNLHLCADFFIARHSGLPFQRVSLVRVATGELLSVHMVPHDEVMFLTGLGMPCGETMQVVTEAISGAGVAAQPLASDLLVDCSAPAAEAAFAHFTSAQHGPATVSGARVSPPPLPTAAAAAAE